DFAVRQTHRELEVLPFRIAPIREIGIELVFGTDCVLAIAFRAGILRVQFGRRSRRGKKANKADGCKTARARLENTSVEHGGCLEHPARRDTSANSKVKPSADQLSAVWMRLKAECP